MMKNKLVVVDVETTGLYSHKSSLVSIGAVKISDPKDTYYGECRIWPGAEVDPGALRVNGMSKQEITSLQRQTEAELIKDFLAWLPKGPVMIAHNASFDRDFIADACKRAGLKTPFGFRTVDIHSIVLLHLMRESEDPIPKSLSLNKCLESLGLPKEPNPHNALTGAKCEAELFIKVLEHGSST